MTPFFPNNHQLISVGMMFWCFLCGFDYNLETSCPLAEGPKRSAFSASRLRLVPASTGRQRKELFGQCAPSHDAGGKKILQGCYMLIFGQSFSHQLWGRRTLVFFSCFLVERNAPQKRPVLFAKIRPCNLNLKVSLWNQPSRRAGGTDPRDNPKSNMSTAKSLTCAAMTCSTWHKNHKMGLCITKGILPKKWQKKRKLLCKNCKMLVF